jgi:hypothetical protein
MATAPSPDPGKTITSAPNWIHEPSNPNLDLVVDDLVLIVQHLIDQQPADGDDVAPVTAASVTPEANPAGWHNDDVQVDLVATDAGSGVQEVEHTTGGAQTGGPTVTPGAVAQELITTEGETIVRFFARDQAGNVEGTQELTVRLDRTAPDITAETDAAPNAAGWFNHAVTVSFPAFDALSGLASSSPDQVITTEGAGQDVLGTAEDVAGNLASASTTLNIDLTAPAIVLTTPADGAAFLLNAVVDAAYDCTDALSGVADCDGTRPAGAAIDTSSVGEQSFAVNARDQAGNVATRAHVYAVRYGFSGFAPPLAPGSGATTVNAGRVVPIKYALFDAAGAPVSDLGSFVSVSSSPMSCDGEGFGEAIDAPGAGDTTIRYDAEAGQFIYNWRTERAWAGSCRMLELTLNDGTRHSALFQFR